MPDQLTLIAKPSRALVPGPVFCCFELQGEPRGKGRHRYRIVFPKEHRASVHDVMQHAFTQEYPDPKTKAFEDALAWGATSAMRGKSPSLHPIALLVHAFKPVPVSYPRKLREDCLEGVVLPTGKSDWDNYGKVTDAFNGIVWKDDAQVCDGRVIKRYSEQPGMRFEIREFVSPIERG